MPIAYKGIDFRGVKDPAARNAFREFDRFLRGTAIGNFGDFETKEDSGAGLVMKVGQRRFRLRIAGSGTLKGGAEIQVASDGTTTGARDSGATGTIIVKLEDLGP